MKILIAVASKHGSTREIAQAIAEQLRAEQFDVDLREAGDVSDISGNGAVILGSAIYMGSWMSEAKKFAERHQAALATLPVWLFSSGPLGDEDSQPPQDLSKLAAPLGPVEVRDHRVFVGKLDPAELGLGERLITKMVHAPAGDFRDWDEIRDWAHQIATGLRAEAAA